MDNRIRLTDVSRRTPTVSSGRKAAVLGARRRVPRTPPGSESRAGLPRGDVGTWENHLSPCDIPGEGDRAPPGPGVAWGLPPGCAPLWDTTNARQHARYREASAKRSDPRRAGRSASRSRVPVKVGNRGPRDPREGRRRRASRCGGRKAGRDCAITNRHNDTPTHGRASGPRCPSCVYDVGPPERRRRPPSGIPPHEQVERRRYRWGNGAAVCRTP